MIKLDLAATLQLPTLSTQLEQVERAINSATATDSPLLQAPITRLVSLSGKRLRPSLVIAVAQPKQLTNQIITGCVAVELVHLATLVHDDIIDDSATRRGTPTINGQEGLAAALLVGDYLLAKACEQAATITAEAARLIATTITQLCEGQARELADSHNLHRTTASYLATIRGKTGALMATACGISGVCAELDDAQTTALTKFGEAFGIAFQLIDDLLDLLSTPQLMNKPVGADIRSGIYTLPILLSRKKHSFAFTQQLLKSSPDMINSQLLTDGSIGETIDEIKNYNHNAKQALGGLNDQPGIAQLAELPEAYLTWAVQNLIKRSYQTKVASYL